jgi:electron transfer flavoprotein beta subunit
LISVDFPPTGALPLTVVRRLDGGRRERSIVHAAAVLSVEGSVARLRRASLGASLASQSHVIDIVETNIERSAGHDASAPRPYRPRARSIPAPRGATPLDRVRAVTESTAPKGSGEPIMLDPPQAAATILERLREWGYVQ